MEERMKLNSALPADMQAAEPGADAAPKAKKPYVKPTMQVFPLGCQLLAASTTNDCKPFCICDYEDSGTASTLLQEALADAGWLTRNYEHWSVRYSGFCEAVTADPNGFGKFLERYKVWDGELGEWTVSPFALALQQPGATIISCRANDEEAYFEADVPGCGTLPARIGFNYYCEFFCEDYI
ncbi:MAG: hypothetical protein IJ722_02770 [Alloprevotella sp.]|nr:hypothetical protein [Alloprevotella sp.]